MKNLSILLATLSLCALTFESKAQNPKRWEDIDSTGYFKKDISRKNGYTLIFINKDSLFNPQTITRLKDAFWKVYPAQVKLYNRKSTKTVTVVIGLDYRGVAATLNGVVKIDQNWLKQHPEDIDVITHELMHIVQGYTYAVPDNWLTDGIADYARYAFGVNNEKSGWSLTPYKEGQSYKNSYRIAARFLVWVEKNKCADLVKKLDEALRTTTYNSSLWVTLTGKNIDDLWKEYADKPNI